MSGTVGRKPPRAVLWGKLAWHPAAAAWSAFAAGAAEPERIEVLRNGKKAGTYRLVGAGRQLPDGGPLRYRDHLHAGRHTIRVHIANPALTPPDVDLLERLVTDLDALERRWAGIADACTSTPPTLTHGDIQRKNIYVRSGPSGPALFLIDWETAGWGVPAADLTLVDLPTYWSVVRPRWPHVRLEDVRRLAAVGRVFLQLAGIRWVSPELAYDQALYLTRPIAWLRVLHERLADAVRELEALP